MKERSPAQLESDKEFGKMVNKSNVQREKKVLLFLRDHPGSDCDEIFAATGVGVSSVRPRFIRRFRKDGKWRYYFDKEKFENWEG